MNRKKLIIGLIFTSFLSLSSLKANLQGELVKLNVALTNLERQLRVQPQPLARDLPPCPVQQRPVQQPAQQARPQRPRSAFFPRTPLSQSEEIPAAKPKPAPRTPSLAQTTPPGGIPVAQPKPGPRAPTTGVSVAARLASIQKEEPEKGVERPIQRRRPQSARYERPPLEEPTKKTVNWVNLKNSIQQLVSLPSTGPEQTARKKLEAKATLDAISDRVETTKLSELRNRQAQLWEAIRPILTIDPLLIQSATNILRKGYLNASDANPELYKLMTDLYENRISFLENEFKKIKPGFKLAKGIRDDIDEGLTYPIEISGEVQDAQIRATKNGDQLAENFFNTTNEQWARLLGLLQGLSEQQREALRDEGIDVDEYINNIEQQKSRTYCRLKQDKQCLPYKSIYEDLQDLERTIDRYEELKDKNLKNHKAFAIQNIINKLKAFNSYSTDKNFCQYCLDEDTNKSNTRETQRIFTKIQEFIANLLTEKQDLRLEQALEIIEKAKQDEQKRRDRVKKEGVGSTYY